MFGRCATLCCLLTVGLCGSVPVHAAELHPHSKLKIDHEGDSWTCVGIDTINGDEYTTISFGLENSPVRHPVVIDDSVFILERIFEPEGSMQCFIRQPYCLTQFSIASGEVRSSSYLTVHTNAEHPIQVHKLLRWGDHLLVDGAFQEEPGLFTHRPVLQLIDSQGELADVLLNDLFWDIETVDQVDELLICTQDYGGLDSEGHKIPIDPVFHLFDLSSFALRATYPQDPLILGDMVTDEGGHLYCLRFDTQAWEAYMEGDAPYPTTRCLVKYSVEPWQVLWMRKLEPESDAGHPCLLRYHNGLLWYSMYDRGYNWENGSEERYRWIEKPLDPENGEPVDTDKRFDPYRTVVDVQGQPYAITWLFDSFRVEPVGSPVGKWEGYR